MKDGVGLALSLLFLAAVLWRQDAFDQEPAPRQRPAPAEAHAVWNREVRRLVFELGQGRMTLAQACAALDACSRDHRPDYLRWLASLEPALTQRLRLAGSLLRHLDAELDQGASDAVSGTLRNLQVQWEAMRAADFPSTIVQVPVDDGIFTVVPTPTSFCRERGASDI